MAFSKSKEKSWWEFNNLKDFEPHSQHKCYNFRSSWGFGWRMFPPPPSYLVFFLSGAARMRIYCGLSLITCSPWLDFQTDYRSLISRQLHSIPLWPSLLREELSTRIRICTWDIIACHVHLVSARFPNWFRFWWWFRLIWKWHRIAIFLRWHLHKSLLRYFDFLLWGTLWCISIVIEIRFLMWALKILKVLVLYIIILLYSSIINIKTDDIGP